MTWQYIPITDSTQVYWGRAFSGAINLNSTFYVGGYFLRNPADTMRPAVYMSTDDGENWIDITGNLLLEGALWVQSIAVEPYSDSVIYVATLTGVYKTTNCGLSWYQLTSAPADVHCLAIDRHNPDIVYGSGGRFVIPGIGVYVSTDAGQTWTAYNQGLPTTDIIEVVSDQLISERVYVGTRSSGVYIRNQVGIQEETSITTESWDRGAIIFSGSLHLPEGRKCRVFNITGSVIAPEKMQPGLYFVEVDGKIQQKVIKIR
jgi:photosystem II stability/assembly factor-like uncharacterized protein